MIRMWALRLAGVMIFAHAVTHPSQAARSMYTGSELLDFCSKDQEPDWGVCLGFIVGVSSSFDCEQLLLGRFSFQPPDGATAGQMKKIVIKYLNERPEKLHLPAASLAAAALSEAFPCQ